jgi:hypothetical protein
MITVTAQYTFEDHEEKVSFEFPDNTPQEDIEQEVEQDFWAWAQMYDYGWHIVERTQ